MKQIYFFNSLLIRRILFLGVFLVSLNGIVVAGNGKITGRVIDKETGEPLPSATVIITHTVIADGKEIPMNKQLGAATDVDGYYFIMNVPPGVYTISASIIGYGTTVQRMVKVEMDRTITLNFNLSSASIQTGQVVVTAPREIIKQDVSSTQEVITSVRIEQMPVLRLDEFVGRLKGVELTSSSEGNGLSIRGGSIRETDVRLDGMSLQDPRSGASYLALNSTTVQEMQVLTGGFEAKYGGFQSGLLNVVTKEGERERYTASFKLDVTPAGQQRFFGVHPWSDESMIYKVFAGQYAMEGIRTHADSMNVPAELQFFKGWNHSSSAEEEKEIGKLTPDQRLELWKAQHPQYSIANKPDYYFEGAITGPLPGASIPGFGSYAEKTTFMLGFKYENSQFAFPIGPKNNYEDWNVQLKLTSQLPPNMKLSINGMYAKTNSLTSGGTSTYGGALIDQSSLFGFLNSTDASVRSQAKLIGGYSWNQVFNRSRLQYFDQRYIIGGSKLTHTLSSKAFYTLDIQFGYTDQQLKPYVLDTSDTRNYISFVGTDKQTHRFLLPNGSPNGSTNFGSDPTGTFVLYGGLQRVDSSYTATYQVKWDMTAQLGRHNQLETGISARLEDFFVYSGTWAQSQISFTPDTWQYEKMHPLLVGLYAQDKLEFEGMILNAGLRLDYFNPMKKGYQISIEDAGAYYAMMNQLYNTLPGTPQSYERWVAYRDLLANPPGWPTTENNVQLYLSPRLGVSFPITESSKMYFNYGYFYQRPSVGFLYNTYTSFSSVAVPTPSLKMERTVSYEFGYEQMFMDDFIFNVTAYYKDVQNRPLSRQYITYDKFVMSEYTPDAYSDTRGVELRLERPLGKFVSFSAMYDYMLTSYGQSGFQKLYEDRMMAQQNKDEQRATIVSEVQPLPKANINLNLHTPSDFGPEIGGTNLLGSIYANIFFEWRSNPRVLLNPQEPDRKLRNYVDALNYWNIDLRASKTFEFSFASMEFVLTVKNLTNNKWLSTGNMTQAQYSAYKNSLRTPDKGGDDKWGQYKSDDGHIETGWMEAPLFLNPRRIILGIRLNL
ncbi:MAG: TonB-dependent receptor [Ignavibacteriales bacterium]